VDALRDAHVARLDEQYATGLFPAPGRKEPRDGGAILAVAGGRAAVAGSRARVEEAVAGGPFVTAGVRADRVTEFIAAGTAPEPAHRRGTLGPAAGLTCPEPAGGRSCSCPNGP
jgi:uncharacterized protein YciI